MEYQDIIKLLDNENTQPSKFRTKDWAEINDDARETYNTNSRIKFKTTMLKSSPCDHSDAYVLDKGTLTVADTAAEDVDANNTTKKIIFKNYSPFTIL